MSEANDYFRRPRLKPLDKNPICSNCGTLHSVSETCPSPDTSDLEEQPTSILIMPMPSHPVICDECGLAFENYRQKNGHMNAHKEINARREAREARLIHCPRCGMNYTVAGLAERHGACECGYRFPSPR